MHQRGRIQPSGVETMHRRYHRLHNKAARGRPAQLYPPEEEDHTSLVCPKGRRVSTGCDGVLPLSESVAQASHPSNRAGHLALGRRANSTAIACASSRRVTRIILHSADDGNGPSANDTGQQAGKLAVGPCTFPLASRSPDRCGQRRRRRTSAVE